ncbi:hypothetical protein [Hymenobacter swuensis]|uniref:Secreted protein n=1 Tax=Hymenobacter swuensis DY53 TaxID=1227739 RepID=W8EQ99_9BACT|nr:hypothetical protein [Hymenobacter swuensis]AHJ95349.1 hypothetical protein Hsw_PA0016 [Hymenobacter swuensis DY53]
MLTLRSLSLTFLGLLTGFAAAAQSAPTAGPTPTTILSWVTWTAAGVVLLMAIITAGSVTSAAKSQYEAPQAEPEANATRATVVADVASSQAAPAEMAPVQITAQEEIYA